MQRMNEVTIPNIINWMNTFSSFIDQSNQEIYSIEEIRKISFYDSFDPESLPSDIKKDVEDLQKDPYHVMINKRSIYLGFVLTPIANASMSRFINSPGEMVMYLAYFAYRINQKREEFFSFEKNGRQFVIVTFNDIISMIDNKFLNESQLHDLWIAQKINRKDSSIYSSDNGLDYLDAEVITKLTIVD